MEILYQPAPTGDIAAPSAVEEVTDELLKSKSARVFGKLVPVAIIYGAVFPLDFMKML